MTSPAIAPMSRTARLAGALYLAMMPFGFFGIIYVPTSLVVSGDPSATVENILASELLFRSGIVSHLIAQVIFIFLVLTLYRLLESVDKRRAVLMVVLALVGIPMAMLIEVNHLAVLELLDNADAFPRAQLYAQAMWLMETRGQGVLVTQVFWGLWLVPLGLLVFKSGFLPKFLGVLLIIAGAGYVFDSATQLLFPGFPVVSFFTFVGELLFTLWLLVKGVDGRK